MKIARITAILLSCASCSLATIQPIVLAQNINPTSINGAIDSNSPVLSDDNSYYNTQTFEGKAGEQITIELSSSEFDPYLILLDPENNKIAEDNDGGGGKNARIVVTLPATGTYTIVANSYQTGQTGKYTLSWRASTAEELELAEAERLNQQVLQLLEQGKYSTAIPLAQRALAIREKVLGAEHPTVATSLNNLALLYDHMGNYAAAEPLYQRALAIWEKVLGAEHPTVATSLNNLAVLYQEMGNYSAAFPLYQRALAIREKVLGVEHPDFATSVNNLAVLYRDMGNYSAALPLFQRALAIWEKGLGVEHPTVATSLDNLAVLYREMGNYSAALPLFQRALAIWEKALGSEHPDVATSLNNLASLYQDMGNYSAALSLYQRALAIWEKALGAEHLTVATSLNNLANLYLAIGNSSSALPLCQRALAIREKVLGSENLDVAYSLNSLAELYRNMGNYAAALPLYQRTIAIREKVLGAEHPHVANSLNNLALLYLAMGNYTAALPLHQRALGIWEKVFGSEHPNVAGGLNNLAGLYQAQNNIPRATEFLQRGTNIEEKNLSLIFTTGSESEKRAYLNTLSGTTDRAISLNLQFAPNNSEATRLALTTLLRRKGRVLDALAESLDLLRQNLTPENQTILDQLATTRRQLAALIYNKPENLPLEQYRQQVTALKTESDKLEAELSRRSAEFRIASEPVTIEAVQQLIPADAALVEIALYYPFDPKAKPSEQWAKPRYAAYILKSTGEPQVVDLGDAAVMDKAIKEFIIGLTNLGRRNLIKTTGRALDAILMQPIRAKLGSTKNLLISPDGQLNLIPFAALIDENEQYLVENYRITYLTTGRDLIRLALKSRARENPVVIANPDYNNADPTVQIAAANPSPSGDRSANTQPENRRSDDLKTLTVNPLPYTAAEAAAIAPLLNNPTVLTGSRATENALKQVQSPSILHIATHGFFLDVDLVAPPDEKTPQTAPRQENPLLRSGLALAGMNIRASGSEDGVLTALEAAQLNLRGTQLVVLSACETGVGDTANGEGVYGLRRALTIAGAKSQVMSLWSVSDEGTKQLMVKYYQRVLRGEAVGEAMRGVQLEMLQDKQDKKFAHPYYWAAFVPVGDWGAIDN